MKINALMMLNEIIAVCPENNKINILWAKCRVACLKS
jgi:hypothetical protein